MFLLYRACTNEYSKEIKALALSQGADVDLEEDWYAPEDKPPPQAMQAFDIMQLGINLGYEQQGN